MWDDVQIQLSKMCQYKFELFSQVESVFMKNGKDGKFAKEHGVDI